jgi:hypothetical protein
MKLSSSPDKGKHSISNYEERLLENPGDEMVKMLLNMYTKHNQMVLELEESDEWKQDNLEYDLRTNPEILEKAKDNIYAQHIYAALCNNEFQRNDVIPILTDKVWSCSWRYAGGIVADMRQEGDYIDWYCSGSNRHADDISDHVFNEMTEDEKLRYLETRAYVAESVVTDEIKQDLFKLGWLVVENNNNNKF